MNAQKSPSRYDMERLGRMKALMDKEIPAGVFDLSFITNSDLILAQWEVCGKVVSSLVIDGLVLDLPEDMLEDRVELYVKKFISASRREADA